MSAKKRSAGLFSGFRFLPLVIFAATLMLSVKIGGIWSGLAGLDQAGIAVAPAKAQEGPEVVEPPEDLARAARPLNDELSALVDDAAETEGVAGESEAAPEGPTADEEAAVARLVTRDPTLLTPEEIEILQKLAERRDRLDAREREMSLLQGLLDAAEIRISNKVKELQLFQHTINGLIEVYDEQQEMKIASLVKIYENMKPKDAASIFGELEMETLLEVTARMKERKLSPVMAEMDPQRARELTIELMRLRELPEMRPSGN
ncbi:MAG: MotE family protein [Rhodospirillales bacterium]